MQDMIDRVAIVTGGAGDIGLSCATALARRGATVVIADLDGDRARACADDLAKHGMQAHAVRLDVADRDGCREICAEIGRTIGRIAVLVNNAGVTGRARLGDEQSAFQWDQALQVNLTGMYNMTVACLAGLKAGGGAVVNMCSVVGLTSGFAHAGYGASKGGVKSLTQAMCRELTGDGIRVNAVAPGYIKTSMMAGAAISGVQEWVDLHCPMKRFGQPDEVGKVVAFLCSDEASFVNGATIPIDGGYLIV